MIDMVDVVLYGALLLLEVTGVEVVVDSDEVVLSAPDILLWLVVCEWAPYVDGVEAIDIFSVVPIDEEDTVDSDVVVLGVTDALIEVFVE